MYQLRSNYYNKWQPVHICQMWADEEWGPTLCEGKFEHNIVQGLDIKIVLKEMIDKCIWKNSLSI